MISRMILVTSQRILFMLASVAMPLGAADSPESPNSVHVGMFQEKLLNANPAAGILPAWERVIPSYYFADRGAAGAATVSTFLKAQYRQVFPGIDRACYGDDFWMEEVFRLGPGADPGRINISIRNAATVRVDEGGDVFAGFDHGEMILGRPVVVCKTAEGRSATPGSYTVNNRGEVSIQLPTELQSTWARAGAGQFNVVTGGGQFKGPSYDFYVSKFEATNDELLKFLNNAEANQDNAQGANMFFDGKGNVWISPEMKAGRDEMFSISNSHLLYDNRNPAGRRYIHSADARGFPAFAHHPVTGLSWYGAVKYCNWLTILSGRGEKEVCYSEGTNGLDWAPVTATNWVNGRFEDDCRAAWLKLKGFRLPMSYSAVPQLTAGKFDEFYKVAAWNGITNTHYGFGRNTLGSLDANYRMKDGGALGTRPVGFFDGTNMIGGKLTHDCQNYFGVYDISGNVEEWLTDFAASGSVLERGCAGGDWEVPLPDVAKFHGVAPWTTDSGLGFRVTTAFMPEDEILVHILYRFYMEPEVRVVDKLPVEVISSEPAAASKPFVAGEDPGGLDLNVGISSAIRNGISYTNIPTEPIRPGPKPEPEPEPGPGPKPHPPPVTTNSYTLTIGSKSPSAGVAITVSPLDLNGYGSHSSPAFERFYRAGTVVTLTAPATVGPHGFVKWQMNGSDYSVATTITVTINGNYTLTAVYKVTAPPVSFSGL